jgi:hypothetical protein
MGSFYQPIIFIRKKYEHKNRGCSRGELSGHQRRHVFFEGAFFNFLLKNYADLLLISLELTGINLSNLCNSVNKTVLKITNNMTGIFLTAVTKFSEN